MIKTISIGEIEKKADNIYEAIVVLAKRARQINGQQKALLQKERDYSDEYEIFDEDSYETPDIEYVKLPKPSKVALDEYTSDKIKFEYTEEDKDDGDDTKK